MRRTNKKRNAEVKLAETPANTTGNHATRRLRWWPRLLTGVAVPIAVFLAAEGILWLAGYGYPTHFFLNGKVDGHSIRTDNQDFGRRFFPPGLLRHPRPFTIPAGKPSDTLRIFVLGESAAMGDPDPKFGMPRMLQILLRERFPGRRVEVVNAAMVAINSHVILPITQDSAGQQANLWIIYMGNNEIIGPFGSASVFGARAPPLSVIRAGIWLKTTRLGQLLDAALRSARPVGQNPRSWAGMEMMADQKVRHNAPATERVYRHFEQNLTDMLEIGARANVPILLCTVATNLKDCAPFASLHRPDLTLDDFGRWKAAYDIGAARQRRGEAAEAKAAYEEAARIDDEYAELTFRRAQCYQALGLNTEAASLFRRARDQDALQFRADGRINGIIRQAASAFGDRAVTLFDAESLFATNSPEGIAGTEYFYEHVHFTPEGNYLLARALAEQVIKTLALPASGEWVSESECLSLSGLTDSDRFEALQTIMDRVQGAPFTNQINYAGQMQRIKEQLARYRLGSKPAQVRRDLQRVSKLVPSHPDDADLRWSLAVLLENSGDAAGAEEEWRKLISMQPQAALPRFNLAKLLDRLGRPAEAYSLFKEGLRINPEYYPARYALGVTCMRLDRMAEAIRHLNWTVDQKPAAVEPRLALSQALVRVRRLAEAENQLREVLRMDPDNAMARTALRDLSASSVRR